MDTLQLLENPEASVSVLRCTGRFAATTTAAGIKVAVAVPVKPGTVEAVRKLQAHHVAILHRGTIHSVFGVNQESGVTVIQPVVTRH